MSAPRRRLGFLLDAAGAAYADYRAGGQRFRDAQRLYVVNTRIEALLLEQGDSWPEADWPHVAALLQHLQVWRLLWEDTRARENPAVSDVFAFANTVTFPHDSVAALCAVAVQPVQTRDTMPSSSTEKTLIIAEAGVNHNGDMDMARRLIDAAAEAGADLVKFQTFTAATLASASARKASYQARNEGTSGDADDGQLAMLKRLELPRAEHAMLIEHCAARGIGFFSTGFDLDSLDFLNGLGFDAVQGPLGRDHQPAVPASRRRVRQGHHPLHRHGLHGRHRGGDRGDRGGGPAARTHHRAALHHRISCSLRRGEPACDEHHRAGLWGAGGLFRPHAGHSRSLWPPSRSGPR